MSTGSVTNMSYWLCHMLAALLLSTSVGAIRFRFPRRFLFGAATAAYQIEGGWDASGKGVSIWDVETHSHPEYMADFTNGDVAADSLHLYDNDINALSSIGTPPRCYGYRSQFYRFSISWPRILPKGLVTEVNQAGIDYYNNLIDGLLGNNIQPMVTIYHWDLPQTLQDLGGWANSMIVDYYEDYARLLFKTFGDRVKWWITINEPTMIALGYVDQQKEQAPSLSYPGIADYLVTRTILLAHARAYHVYDEEFRAEQDGKVGMTLNINWYEPRTFSSEDLDAAERAIQFEFGLFTHPIYSKTGDYPAVVKQRVAENSRAEGFYSSRLQNLTAREIDYIRGTGDFLGLNYYTGYWAEAGLDMQTPSRKRDSGATSYADPSCPMAISDWLSVLPWGFRKVLRWIKQEYNNPPVLITENGYSDDGRLNDTERVHYLVDHLREMLKAMYEDGCNIIGYTVWSLLDNFQWSEGYRAKFGLVYVNFSDPSRSRVLKESADVYNEIIRERRVPGRYPLYRYDNPTCRPTVPL